ncbi:sodium-dependent glucose transporter 1A-like [Glandiceps talaboti]
MSVGIIGPSLPDFQLNTGVNVDHIALIFATCSIGYAIGSILGGILFDKLDNHLLLTLAVLASAVVGFLFPWCTTLAVLVLVSNVAGLVAGVLDTGGNTVCVDLWRNKSGLYMQALHFVFALGATASPLIAGPFLTPINSDIMAPPTNQTNMSVLNSTYSPIVNSSIIIHNYIDPTESLRRVKHSIDLELDDTRELYAVEGKPEDRRVLLDLVVNRIQKHADFRRDITSMNVTMGTSYHVAPSNPAYTFNPDENGETETELDGNYKGTTPGDHVIINQNSTKEHERESTLWVPYTLVSVYYLLITFPFLWLFLNGPRNLRVWKPKGDSALEGKKLRQKESKSFKVTLLSLIALYIFLYAGQEALYGSFVYSYAIHSSHGLSKESASYLNALFWGCFAAGRGLGILCAVFLSPKYMTIIDLIGMSISTGLLAIFGSNIIEVLWFATGLLGISMAAMFPSGISWTEKYIRLTGKSTSVFLVSASVAGVVLPLALGQLFIMYGYDTLLYMMAGLCLGTVVMFIIMQTVASRHGKLYSKARKDEARQNNAENPFSRIESNAENDYE